MSTLIHTITVLWRFRGRLLLCILVLPLLAYLYSQNKVESYTATTTLYINPNLVTSPLLQDMAPNEHRAILARMLAAPDILEPSLASAGLMLPGVDDKTRHDTLRSLQSRLRLNTLSSHLLQVKLQSTDRASILPLLEAISYNFRDQLLAPERFSNDAELTRLAEKVKFYQEKISAAETTTDQSADAAALGQLRTSLLMAQSEFNAQKRKAQLGNASAALRVLEAPTLVANPVTPTADILLVASLLGLVLGLALVWLGYRFDSSLRSDKDIHEALQLRVLGRMPDFGKLHVQNGRQTT